MARSRKVVRVLAAIKKLTGEEAIELAREIEQMWAAPGRSGT